MHSRDGRILAAYRSDRTAAELGLNVWMSNQVGGLRTVGSANRENAMTRTPGRPGAARASRIRFSSVGASGAPEAFTLTPDAQAQHDLLARPRWSLSSRRPPCSNLARRVLGWPPLSVLCQTLAAHVLGGEGVRRRWGRRWLWRQTRRRRHFWLLCLRCLLHPLGEIWRGRRI